ncbi:MAG TPA: L-aspartate oxidase, partial [Clostridiales bacterium]|nr:L-aspartate oxidase [Clostridiales bacterium]
LSSENKSDDYEDYSFNYAKTDTAIPKGIRTEIRRIMQESYFVIPDKKFAVEGYERVLEIKRMLTTGNYIVNDDFIEAKSLATIAYLILKEVI